MEIGLRILYTPEVVDGVQAHAVAIAHDAGLVQGVDNDAGSRVDEIDADVLKLPFGGSELSMFVVSGEAVDDGEGMRFRRMGAVIRLRRIEAVQGRIAADWGDEVDRRPGATDPIEPAFPDRKLGGAVSAPMFGTSEFPSDVVETGAGILNTIPDHQWEVFRGLFDNEIPPEADIGVRIVLNYSSVWLGVEVPANAVIERFQVVPGAHYLGSGTI